MFMNRPMWSDLNKYKHNIFEVENSKCKTGINTSVCPRERKKASKGRREVRKDGHPNF